MKKKILLVEYAASSIDVIKDILSPSIFEITIVNEGETAKKYLEQKAFDLMITAAMLPRFHGFNLSQYTAENHPNTKIIIISEIYKGMDYKHQAVTQYKANDFFEKPFDNKKFRDRVYELLEISQKTPEAKVTTQNVPIADTKKMPTMKKIEDQGKKLSSEDLFGDIIQKVHDLPAFDKKPGTTDNKNLQKKKPQGTDIPVPPPVTQKITPPVTQMMGKKPPAVPQAPKTPSTNKTQSIDDELLYLIKRDRNVPPKEISKTSRNKRIEEDISKKLEDTLSGLGISGKPSPATKEIHKKEATKPFKLPKIETKPPKETDEVGGYEILGLIGRGGMAEIFKAKKKGVKGFEKIIALKKILSGYGTDAKYIEMFVDEAKIAAELSHPNIVQIYDLGKKDDYYFIAMEYISGKDLRVILHKLAEKGTIMPEPIALYLIINVLSALNYAHAAKNSNGKRLDIVHRDISPPNILVSYEGNIKLTDFGVSKASIKMHQTLAGALKGKLLYMSPEQAKGDEYIDYRSDLYSVGIILFELITGEKLFLGSSEISTLKKVQEGKVIKPSQIKKNIEPEMETILLKALNKEMTRRYQSAADMIKDMEAYMKSHYNNIPEASHVAHFIAQLFKTEIIKDKLDINLTPLPYPITKKVKKEEKIKEEILPDLPEEEQLESQLPFLEEEIVEKETELLKKEEFQPIIEIDFDEDKKQKPPSPPTPPVKKAPAPKPSPIVTPFGSLTESHDSKKKKNLMVAALIVIAVLALAIVLFIMFASGESDSKPTSVAGLNKDTPSQVVQPVTDQKPMQEDEQQPITTETEADDSKSDAQIQEVQKKEKPPVIESSKEIKSSKPEPQESQKKHAETTQVSTSPPTSKIEKTPLKKDEKVTPPESEIESKKVETEEVKPEEKQISEQEKQEIPVEKTTEEITQPLEQEQKPPATKPKEPIKVPKQEEIIKTGDILSPSQLDTQPIPISEPSIRLTRSIRQIMTSDQRILVSYLVDHYGNVETVKVLKTSSMKKLNNLIVETILKWKYKPATKNNVKVKVWKNKWLSIKK